MFGKHRIHRYFRAQKILKKDLKLLQGEVIDASVMSRDALRKFLAKELNKASEEDVLFSLHMKATMMKVSDPIIFGHCVEAYLGEIIDEYGEILIANGFNPNNGLASLPSIRRTRPGDKNQNTK